MEIVRQRGAIASFVNCYRDNLKACAAAIDKCVRCGARAKLRVASDLFHSEVQRAFAHSIERQSCLDQRKMAAAV